jgi:hypothetical protein
MALSKNTLDHLLEAESHLRAAVKSAAVNEKPMVVKQLEKMYIEDVLSYGQDDQSDSTDEQPDTGESD